MPVCIPFDNSYVRLPARLHARLDPTPVAAPRLVRVNAAPAKTLGLDPDDLASPEGVAILSGNRVPDGADPIALAYAGHQFGHFVPQLGDGRAILLGEIVGTDGTRHDIQLKGTSVSDFRCRKMSAAHAPPVQAAQHSIRSPVGPRKVATEPQATPRREQNPRERRPHRAQTPPCGCVG